MDAARLLGEAETIVDDALEGELDRELDRVLTWAANALHGVNVRVDGPAHLTSEERTRLGQLVDDAHDLLALVGRAA